MSMFAPTAPNNKYISEKEGEDMVAASVKVFPQKERTKINKLHEGFLMAIQKANTPSISISPAVIGLMLTIAIQSGLGIWWAASLSKDSDNNMKEIQTLKNDNASLKVYIDSLREKQIKMESTQENILREQQVLNLLLQQKGVK